MEMIELDGASGGGQLLRTALTLSLCTGIGFTMQHIRAKRSRPGLMRQHLTAVNAAATIGQARTHGAELGATVDAAAWRSKLEGWSARLAAAWSRGDDVVRDKPLNSIDPPSVVLGLRYEQPSTGRWGVSEILCVSRWMTSLTRSTRIDLRTGWPVAPWQHAMRSADSSTSPRCCAAPAR